MTGPVTPRNAVALSLVAKAVAIVRTRFNDHELTLAATASELSISPWHLSRLLGQHTGCGFGSHVRDTRVRAAVELLVTTTLSVKEIAGAVGFGHVNQMCRHFKSVHGLTPSQYRCASMTTNGDSSHETMIKNAGNTSERAV